MLLFRVEPIGRETEEVESFSSYVLRLAKVHGVSVGRMLTELKAAYTRENPGWQEETVTDANPATLADMVRPVDSAAELLEVVEHYTGVSGLRSTTFQALRQACYRSVGLFHNHMRWCPACFEEDLNLGMTPYFRLLWSFKDVTHCHKHGVPIVTRCPKCFGRQNSTSRVRGIHLCRKCKTPLLEKHRSEEAADRADESDYRDLRELTGFVASNPSLVFEDGAARRLLQAIFDRVWDLEDEREFWKILPKEQSLMISYGDKKLTMKMLRRIAYRLGISLPGLLAGEVDCWTAQLDPRWLSELPANLHPAKRRRRHDRDALRARRQECRQSVDPTKPPPLVAVVKEIGISTGGMEYLFPATSKEIKGAFQKWRIEEKERKRLEATAAVFEYLASDRSPKSRKDALRVIRDQTGLPKNVLREVISRSFLTARESLK